MSSFKVKLNTTAGYKSGSDYGSNDQQATRFPMLNACSEGVLVLSSAFWLLLSQRLLSGKHIVENWKAAQKYFKESKIGEKLEMHHIAHLGQKNLLVYCAPINSNRFLKRN